MAGVLAAPTLAALGPTSRRALLVAAVLALCILPAVVIYGLVEPRVGRYGDAIALLQPIRSPALSRRAK